MDNRLSSCGIFVDLKKTFVTVDHKILLHKLDHYGFGEIENLKTSLTVVESENKSLKEAMKYTEMKIWKK